MSDLKRAFDELLALERAEEEQRSQSLTRGEANVKEFIQLMSEHGISPATIHRRLMTQARTDELLRQVAQGVQVPPEPASDKGWSARFIDDDPRNLVTHFITEDGRVLEVGHPGSTKGPRYVSAEALQDANALAVIARAIIKHGDPHYGVAANYRH